MTEKEKNILQQELWTLVAQDAEATTHCFKISLKQLKCITKEDAKEMTPNKHKVVEELKLLWNFVKTIYEDLGKIAGKLGKAGIVPALPQLVICDELWDTENAGQNSTICEVGEKIADFQTALQDVIWKLQEDEG